MLMRWNCPKCSASFEIEHEGRNHCPSCGQEFFVPTHASAPLPLPTADVAPPRPPKTAAKKFAAVCLVLGLGVCALVWACGT